MDLNEFILDLYKKGYTVKYIANLTLRKMKLMGIPDTFQNMLHLTECTILEFYNQ